MDRLKKQANRLYWLGRYIVARFLARTSARSRLDRIKPRKLLVLCYGNIYRSPFVATYLKNRLDKGFEIRSAGFFHKAGRQSAEDYILLAGRYGVDLSKHSSKKTDRDQLSWADAVIIMDGKNYKLALLMDPGIEHKLIWLGGLLKHGPVEIEDPYNRPPARQLAIVEQMISSCDRCVARLTSC